MKEFVPYVNLDTVKDANGKIEKFVVRTVSYLPDDSTITKSGEGEVADNVYFRPLTITYTGTSTTFKAFDVDFTINRKDIGLLERGANVKVKSAVVVAQAADVAMLRDDENTGTIIEYEGDI
ncbi:hypothetical protein [Carboxylicivirga taeanensis]|uniref:hypothetical protein n=1 Tax=Carboxylicivirga taeanensis TaxID=1416875 RepID=UPI003F6DEB28